jgi:hypothetical protein
MKKTHRRFVLTCETIRSLTCDALAQAAGATDVPPTLVRDTQCLCPPMTETRPYKPTTMPPR